MVAYTQPANPTRYAQNHRVLKTLKYKAPAKLNLFLHITKRRPDAYHELQTLFQLIDYYDELHFDLRTDSEINLSSNVDIPIQNNLVFKAARLLQQQCNKSKGVDIYLHKHIPISMGLGGGSSDAATTLRVLNQLWDCQLNGEQLMAYGRELGADVPLFINGRSAWGEGIGDILQAVELPSHWYTVFISPHQIDTRTMFEYPELKRDCVKVSMEDYLAGRTTNVFEAVIRNNYPQISEDMDWLNSHQTAYLSGSGGAFFAICETEQQASALSKECPEHLQSFVASGINVSPLINELGDIW